MRPSISELPRSIRAGFFEKRQRKGVTVAVARTLMKQNNYFGAMMVEMGHADGLLNGISQSYRKRFAPRSKSSGSSKARLAGIYMMIFKKRVLWFADTTVNIDPTAEELADIAIQTAHLAKSFMVQEPKVAMLSFSNFGSNSHPDANKVRKATEIVKQRNPDLVIDGEMQADTAL